MSYAYQLVYWVIIVKIMIYNHNILVCISVWKGQTTAFTKTPIKQDLGQLSTPFSFSMLFIKCLVNTISYGSLGGLARLLQFSMSCIFVDTSHCSIFLFCAFPSLIRREGLCLLGYGSRVLYLCFARVYGLLQGRSIYCSFAGNGREGINDRNYCTSSHMKRVSAKISHLNRRREKKVITTLLL